MMKYRDSGCCLRCTLIVAVWSILEICRYCFYGCQLCIQGLSPLHSLLELFLSVSTSYPNLRVFHLHSWILTFRSATHEFSLSRRDRGVMAPKSIRSHFRSCSLYQYVHFQILFELLCINFAFKVYDHCNIAYSWELSPSPCLYYGNLLEFEF